MVCVGSGGEEVEVVGGVEWRWIEDCDGGETGLDSEGVIGAETGCCVGVLNVGADFTLLEEFACNIVSRRNRKVIALMLVQSSPGRYISADIC